MASKQLKLEVASPTITYIGQAGPGVLTNDPGWKITRLLTSGDDLDVQSPVGLKEFGGVWDDRATYTYG